ncbi:MAG: hypothetical protein ACJA1L_003243 [Paracoccaceae bacterium]|jgi:hypothetical protein
MNMLGPAGFERPHSTAHEGWQGRRPSSRGRRLTGEAMHGKVVSGIDGGHSRKEGDMRLIAILALSAAAGLAMWAQASTTPPDDGAIHLSAMERQAMRLALADHLRGVHGTPTADLVLSPGEAPDLWRFRARAAPPADAQARGAGQPLPHGALYGDAVLRCAPAVADAACWEVTALHISGLDPAPDLAAR